MDSYGQYYAHLQSIGRLGHIYKRYYVSKILYYQATKFGNKIAEVGSGIGSGLLGAYPQKVVGFEINPFAVAFCQKNNLNVHQIGKNKPFPVRVGEYDVCVLDNVLEHIAEPAFTLEECLRITHDKAGLIISVPGVKGYQSDADHKKFYGKKELQNLHPNWEVLKIFSLPFVIRSETLSKRIPQYCLVAVYQKR